MMGNTGEQGYCYNCEIWFMHSPVRTECPMCDMLTAEHMQKVQDKNASSVLKIL